MTRPRHIPRGFATVMAMVCLTLVSITLAGLMTRISLQARRNQRDADRAQQQQILIAQSLANPGERITLPDELLKH